MTNNPQNTLPWISSGVVDGTVTSQNPRTPPPPPRLSRYQLMRALTTRAMTLLRLLRLQPACSTAVLAAVTGGRGQTFTKVYSVAVSGKRCQAHRNEYSRAVLNATRFILYSNTIFQCMPKRLARFSKEITSVREFISSFFDILR